MSSVGSSTSATPLGNVGGLASGLDTNTIVSQLMAIERNPRVRLQQRQAVEQARQQALKDIQTQLQALQTASVALRDPSLWANSQTVSSNDTTKVTASYTSGATGAPPGGYNITVTQLARAQQLTQTGVITSAAASDTLSIAVGGGTPVTVAITAGDTLQNISDKINATSGVGVFATVASGKIVLSGQSTGAANTIAVTSTGTLATSLGFTQTQAPLDASYTVNGSALTSASNVITSAITGVTLGLVGLTSSAVTVTVGAPGVNSANVQAKIQSFVTTYNATIDLIKGKLDQKRVANPQTAADRAAGVLFGDPGLSGLLASLRQAVGTAFSGQPASLSTLSQIGLSTGASTGSGALSADALAGKLTLDTAKLATALQSNVSGVKALFTNVTGTFSTEGLTQRFDDQLNAYLGPTGLMTSRISSEQSLIDMFGKQITAMDTRLALKERTLRAQFTAMEVALSNSQATASQLGAQLTSLSGGTRTG